MQVIRFFYMFVFTVSYVDTKKRGSIGSAKMDFYWALLLESFFSGGISL